MRVGIIGLGLIGGSIALDLKSSGFASQVFGFDIDENNCDLALNTRLVDTILDEEQVLIQSDLIVVAIPVDVARDLILKLLNRVSNQVITDVGSTKIGLENRVFNHPNRGRLVTGHPIAGTENSGPMAATKGLFYNKTGIICHPERSDEDALSSVKLMYANLGMHLKFMDADAHDKHMAYISHLSHISSFALGLTVLNIEKSEKNIFDLAGSGFGSTVRLAKSSPDMWEPILSQNAEFLERALDEYIDQLHDFKTFLKHKKREDLHAMMLKANEIRRILDGKIKDVKTT